MRKYLLRILQNKVNLKVEKIKKSKMSELLESLKPYMPKEFVRKPRTFNDILNWKATEFRQFLLYTGVLVLKDNVHDDLYYEFLLLHCSCRMLFCPKSYMNNFGIAENMILLFVQNFSTVFGNSSLTYRLNFFIHSERLE